MVDVDVRTVLTADEHEQFLTGGYIILRGAVPPDVIEAALQLLARSNGDSAAEEGRAAVRLCLTERVLAVVRELHGPRIPLGDAVGGPMLRPQTPDELFDSYPHVDHEDGTVVPEGYAIGGFIFLTKVRHRGGAFCYAPGSPLRLRAHMAANTGEVAWGAARTDGLVGAVRECLAEPGDVILYQENMVHAASPNLVDPTTRQALRFFFPLPDRLVPGDTAFDEMSTVEKAHSMRYLRHRFGERFPVLELGDADALTKLLAEGFSHPGGVIAHDVLKLDGATHLFVADGRLIRRFCTRDFESWTALDALELTTDPIRAIHFEHRFSPTLTLVCEPSAGRSWSRMYSAEDLTSWRQMTTAPGFVMSRPDFGVLGGPCLTYFVHDDRPNEIWWRSGASRENFNEWKNKGLAASVPEASRVTDVWARPGPSRAVNDGRIHVLVADFDGRTHYSLSSKLEEFAEPFRPFETDDASPPTHLRVFERAQGFWLVTYERDGRMFWGAVDWVASPGRIRQVRDASQFDEALVTVGLR